MRSVLITGTSTASGARQLVILPRGTSLALSETGARSASDVPFCAASARTQIYRSRRFFFPSTGDFCPKRV